VKVGTLVDVVVGERVEEEAGELQEPRIMAMMANITLNELWRIGSQ
jgi:hypothetical protein